MALLSPPSQKYRQIGFFLTGGAAPDVRLNLLIRPEDLTITEPSRLTVQQTLGGAWADSFDRGVATITLSGTLGWRGGLLLSGEDAFAQLRETVFLAWHQRRADAIAASDDPTDIQLTYVDALNTRNYIVAPESFSLRRSKSSPLLSRYQIRLVVLDDADAPDSILDQITAALSNPLRWLAGVTGLGNVLGGLQTYVTEAQAAFGAASAAVGQFVGTVNNVLSAVNSVASGNAGQFLLDNAQLLTAARSIVQAGANGISALATDPTLPPDLLIPAVRLPSYLVDADCTMANSFSLGHGIVTYDDLFGASTCSSTGGGDPASAYTTGGLNPFSTYFPAGVAPIAVSSTANDAITALSGDPLLLIGQDAMVASNLAAIARGVTVAAA